MLARERRKLILPFLAPFLILHTFLFAYPAIQALPLSLMDFSGIGENMRFIGLANFEELLTDKDFREVLGVTFRFAIFGGLLTLPAGLYFAVILNQEGLPFRGLLKLIVFAPALFSVIATSLLWMQIYNPAIGLLNEVLGLVGLGNLQHIWLGDRHSAFWAVIVVILWHSVGTYMILFLAGLQKVPREFYEAARIDGAGNWSCFVHVTFPLIWDVTRVLILLYTIGALQSFIWQFVITRGGPAGSTETIGMYLYAWAFEFNLPRWGYATAVGVVILILVMTITIVVNKVLTRETVEY